MSKWNHGTSYLTLNSESRILNFEREIETLLVRQGLFGDNVSG